MENKPSNNDSFRKYNEIKSNQPPSRFLLKSLKYVAAKDAALDIGCGSLQNVKYLVLDGFENVDCFDPTESSGEYAEKIKKAKNIHFTKSSVEDFTFEENKYDLVNITLVLHFVKKESINKMIEDIYKSMKSGGILVLNLFATDHSLSQKQKETFYYPSVTDFKKDFEKFETVSINENTKEAESLVNKIKHNDHRIFAILRKN